MKSIVKMIVGALVGVGALSALAVEVTYLSPEMDDAGNLLVDEDGVLLYESKTAECTELSNSSSGGATLQSGWYVVSGSVTVKPTLTISGDVRLVLCNGATLTVDGKSTKCAGLRVEGGNALTVYAQVTGGPTMGKIVAVGGSKAAGIGSGSAEGVTCGKITINGGNIMATGGDSGAGIGGGMRGKGANITINGGEVTAKGGDNAAGIGGGDFGNCENITVNGGTVVSIGGGNGAGIGSGNGEAAASRITVNGGTVMANGGNGSAGIGGGSGACGEYITVNGGTIAANGGEDGSGIGGGRQGRGENIVINGGEVTANGGAKGAGIGGGDRAIGQLISINGGTITANGGDKASGIGGGATLNGQNITITGGRVSATGGSNGAGIGGGSSDNRFLIRLAAGVLENLRISGGTVCAKGGSDEAYDFGKGVGDCADRVTKNVVFTGGTISTLGKIGIQVTPVNASGATVLKTTVTEVAGSPATISGIPNYGVKDLYPDGGNIYLYLPSGSYNFLSTTKRYSGNAGTMLYPSGDHYGIKVNGSEVDGGSGQGWTCANNVLTLSQARAYTLTGPDSGGRLRVVVAANAEVTLSGLTLSVSQQDAPCFEFTSAATDAKLVMTGDNKVYSHGDNAAFCIRDGAKVTVSGKGALVGGYAEDCLSSCFNVNAGGTLILNGGTIRGYRATYGGAVYNSGTVDINGGTIRGNVAGFGSALFNNKGISTIYGVAMIDNGIPCLSKSIGSLSVYGGIYSFEPSSIAGGYEAKLVGELYIVGRDVATKNSWIAGGTYTFNPTNAEYAATGARIAPHSTLEACGTTPETYSVKSKLTSITINGDQVVEGKGEGWTYDGVTLTLTSAMDYTVTGADEVPFHLDVTANARVTLKDLRDIAPSPGREIISITAADATIVLEGANEIHAKDGSAAIGVRNGAKLTLRGDGELVGGRDGGFNGRGIEVKDGGTFVQESGTIRRYKSTEGGAGVFSAGTVEINGGWLRENEAANGSAICATDGSVTVNGGVFADNTPAGDPICKQGTATVAVNGAVSSDPVIGKHRSSGTTCREVWVNYIVGRDIACRDDMYLIGGTYTFNPTNAEYVARDVRIAEDYVVYVHDDTTPKTYRVGHAPSDFTVNGRDLREKSGTGWNFDSRSGLLTLKDAMAYTLSGDGKDIEYLHVLVKAAGATVTLSNVTITADVNSSPLTVAAKNVTVLLAGDNQLTAPSGCAALYCPEAGSITIDRAEGQTDATARLMAIGGRHASGIGGDSWNSGAVTVAGGKIKAIGGDKAAGIGGGYEVEGYVTISGGIVTAIGGSVAVGIGGGTSASGTVKISGGTVTATGGTRGADIGGREYGTSVVISGGSVKAGNVINPKNANGDTVWCVTVPDVTQDGPVALSGESQYISDYGTNDVYPIDNSLYLWLPNGDKFYVGNDEVAYYAKVNGASTVAFRKVLSLFVNGEQVSKGDHDGWSYDEDEKVLTLDGTTNSYVIVGEAMEGESHIEVAGDCVVTIGGVQLGNGDTATDKNLIVIGEGSTVDLVLDGSTYFNAGSGVAPICVEDNATLNLIGSGKAYNWNIELNGSGKVTMGNSTKLAFVNQADAEAAAKTIKLVADEAEFPGIDQDLYASRFDVKVVSGSEAGTWTLDYQLNETTKAAIAESFVAAEAMLAEELADKNPATEIDGIPGLYYGMAGATAVDGMNEDAANPPAWFPAKGGVMEVDGSIFQGTDKAFYQLRVRSKP